LEEAFNFFGKKPSNSRKEALQFVEEALQFVEEAFRFAEEAAPQTHFGKTFQMSVIFLMCTIEGFFHG